MPANRPASRDALKSRGTTEERPVSEADPIPRPRLYKIAHTVRFAPRSFRRHRTRAAADCKSKSVGPLSATTCGPHHRSTTMRFLACKPTCGGKCSAAQCFACLTSSATASAARRRSAGRGCERSSSNGWAAHPNLQRWPHAPAAGRGRLQVQIRLAFVGHRLLSSSQVYDSAPNNRRSL